MIDYFALEVHSCYEMLSSLNHVFDLINRAKTLNYPAIAITDSNMFGVLEFYFECKKNNIKPIIGLQVKINNGYILLYAKTNKGYKNLIKLSTLSYESDLTVSNLQKYQEDLILIIPSSFYSDEIFNIYEDAFVGYNDKLSITNDKKHVFINNVAYIDKDDDIYLDYLQMIRDNKNEGNMTLGLNKGRYLLSNEEYIVKVRDKDIINYKYILDNCNVDIGYTDSLLPVYDESIDADEYLTYLCNKGLKRRLKGNVDTNYQERLNYELDVIKKMDFGNYFLIVWDYVKFAKTNNILVGTGRGSAPSSLVSYCLGITDIDPIKYNLLFERFLNPMRVTMPDIDIDFDADKREEVVNYVKQRYGEKRVVGIVTFSTLKAKQVIRDVARVLNIDVSLIDAINKNLDNMSLKKAITSNSEIKSLIKSSYRLKKLFNISQKLENLPRHTSVHAAAIVMSRLDLDDIIPLYKNEMGVYLSAYSMNYLEGLGLLKMDFLGLKNLTLIDEVITNIRQKENLNITFNNILLNDKATLKLFYDVKTDGIFQFESAGMKKFLEKLKIERFEDIVAAIAMFRPGPMDNIDSYVKRRHKVEKIDYIDNSLQEVLEETYGIIVYQEQIMKIASIMAKYSYGEADILRRAMSKKKEEVLLEEREKFITRSINNQYSLEVADKVYNLILKFANYGFNKSHAVSYSVIAYKCAFLKTHFYKYFMCSLLSNCIGSEIKTKNYILEIKKSHVLLLLPNINSSNKGYCVEDKGIRCGLAIIKNIGAMTCGDILKEREKGLFKGFIDFVVRMKKSCNIGNKIIVNLINAGCFDDGEFNRKTLINNLDVVVNYAELVDENSLFDVMEPTIIIEDEYNKNELINMEYNSFGFYLSNHPVSKYKGDGIVDCCNIMNYFDKRITIVGIVDRVKEIVTKNGEAMAFVLVSDEFYNIDTVFFPKIYNKFGFIKRGNILKITGVVEKRYDKYKIIVNKYEIKNN
ncbi:MAG: DNA polymerase III subunit alpha [bacterium]|nr:DNA polymerase III subunit alpha [bacterium]